MKNIKLLVLMSLMAVLCLPARATEVYTVSSVSGTVNALTPAGKSIPLRVGDAVPALNEVQTGDESTATLISANVEVSIEAKSRLRSEARGSLRLEEGEILAKLKKLPARSIFEVHTPVATATVRGTTLQAIHRDGKSVIVVVEGIVEVVSVDKKGEPRKDIQTLTIGQRALIDETGFLKWNPDEIIADGTEKNADIAGIKVEAVEKAYYIVPSCRVADNISTCPKDEGEDEKPEEKYDDFAMYLGDETPLPVHALLPWSESYLQLSFKNTIYRFHGVMIVCIDYDAKNKKLRIKIFQTSPDVLVTYRNDKTEVDFISNNLRGVGGSVIRVNEGEVAVTTPWLCEDCFAEKTFLVEPGECYQFKYRPEHSDEEIDLPEIELTPPPPMDSMKKKVKK